MKTITLGFLASAAACAIFPTFGRASGLEQGAAPATEDSVNLSADPGRSLSQRRGRIEEIVVTARKRAENLQDVPISIAVVSADDIDRRALFSASDYLRGMPGAHQSEGVPSQSIVVRGLEANTIFQGTRGGETTGTYFGETPTIGAAGSLGSNVDIKLVDIERVEVLRGPQGTAFGSASMGGTVRTIPMPPKLDSFEAKADADFSVTSGTGAENYRFTLTGNAPLVQDKLAIRGTAYVQSDSGFYRNRAGTNAAFQSTVVQPYGAEAYAIDEDEVGAYYVSGGRVSALYQASERLRFSLSYLGQDNETNGIPVATSGPYEQTVLRVAAEDVRRGETLGVLDSSIDIANATIDYDMSWANLLVTYSYLEGGTVYMRPYTSIGFNWAASNGNESELRRNVGEVRLATHLEGDWNFIAGVYVEQNEERSTGDIIWFGDIARSLFPAAGRILSSSSGEQDSDQKAIFGEVSWEFLPGLTATAGARFFEYQREVPHAQGSGSFYSLPPDQPKFEESDSVFRANLSYEPTKGALIYAGWSQGFRPGRSQAGLNGNLCDLNSDGIVDGTSISLRSTQEVNADNVDSYELGGKFVAFNRLMIDAAVFRMDWSGVPVSNVIRNPAIPACISGFQVNAGKARTDGLELQLNLQATDSLRVDLGGSYLNSRIIEGLPAQGFPAGNLLPGAPKVNANLGLQFDFEVAGYPAFVRADAIHVGSFFGDLQNSPVTKAGDYQKVDATARIGVNKFSIDLYVRNLTNEDAFTSRGAYSFSVLGGFDGPYGYQMRPRTVGVRLSYDF